MLRGAANHWPARDAWSPDYFDARYGDLTLPVAALSSGAGLLLDARRGVLLEPRTVRAFVSNLRADRPSGYLMASLAALPASLQADVVTPSICAAAPWRSSKLWFSPRGAVSPLHFDVAHNLHAQIYGRKRFLIYPPRDALSLYPAAPWSSVPNFSRVDPLAPDLRRHPRFLKARGRVCVLYPGDILFLPARFWHHVTSEEVSISVNFWWASGAHALVARAADRWKAWRALSR